MFRIMQEQLNELRCELELYQGKSGGKETKQEQEQEQEQEQDGGQLLHDAKNL
ncbi:hypothetical protein D3C73_1583550 [compost metagenome]